MKNTRRVRNCFAIVAAYALGVISVINADLYKDADDMFYWICSLSAMIALLLTIIIFNDKSNGGYGDE